MEEIFERLYDMTAFSNIIADPRFLIMYAIAFVLLYLGIKKQNSYQQDQYKNLKSEKDLSGGRKSLRALHGASSGHPEADPQLFSGLPGDQHGRHGHEYFGKKR